LPKSAPFGFQPVSGVNRLRSARFPGPQLLTPEFWILNSVSLRIPAYLPEHRLDDAEYRIAPHRASPAV